MGLGFQGIQMVSGGFRFLVSGFTVIARRYDEATGFTFQVPQAHNFLQSAIRHPTSNIPNPQSPIRNPTFTPAL